ncbi:MAG: anthranilate synthase component I [Chloroflexi bacterium]|nr:anthranilate synthase component I [Chloroflexota bacterium]MQC25322.1 anthranilate synthase component I [Chloroflexota bacterium]MQC47476.1 anthranilate synthase component I [Chloroflexota bacterium]
MTDYIPSLNDVRRLTAQGNVVPVYREVRADLETPVSAYLKVARGAYSFLLESVEGGERLGRYSFIGTEPYRVHQARHEDGDPLDVVQEELGRFQSVEVPGLPKFHGGAVGYLGYEAVTHFEPRIPLAEHDALGLPESWLMFTDTILVFDHVKHSIKVVAHVRLDGDIDASYRAAQRRIDEIVERLEQPLGSLPYVPFAGRRGVDVESNWKQEDFLYAVRRCKEYIVSGDIIQVVLSQRFSRETGAHPFEVYRSLRAINPSPYLLFLQFDDTYIVGSSPELLVNIEDGVVEVHPIAGTRRRGEDALEDQRLAEELIHDEKEIAEHVMLLDLGRNDVGHVAEAGSVEVTQRLELEFYSHVMHIVSHVKGRLRDGMTAADALRAAYPAGTVSGAPKIRAMEIIAELEHDRRGPYSGAVGFFDLSGNIETCITIRTLIMKDGMAHVQAGAGIVFDSDPQKEYEECQHKARALLAALDDAERGEGGEPAGSLGY